MNSSNPAPTSPTAASAGVATTLAANAASANPLLDFQQLTDFAQIRTTDIQPAITQLIAASSAALETVTAPDFPADWQRLAQSLDVQTERLGRAWGVIGHLNGVADNAELRAAYNLALPEVSAFWTRLGSDELLYAKYKSIAAKQDSQPLTPEQKQALHNALRSFRLGGAELQGEAKERFAQNQERQAELTQKFSENVLDATQAFSYYASLDELEGVPADAIAAARAEAEAEGQDGYKITLKFPSYFPVMQYAKSSALREKLYHAYVTRASEMSDPAFDNSSVMQEILALRQEEADLLGFQNFAEVSLATKMADSPAQVKAFLRDLAARARPFAEQDIAALRSFAKAELAMDEPQAWDWTYIAEKLKEKEYAFSEQEVKAYFQLPQVLQGLFNLVQELFSVEIKSDTAPVWHADVRFYRVERHGQLLAQFYLDPSAREGKRSGAWMDDARSRWLRPDGQGLQTPVAYLVCNFAPGVGDKPPLLTHDDVITLFHEMGHGLHHMLTQVNERDVSGINGVEWDAVELPSQFMENFCWEWSVLEGMSAHAETGAKLPRALYDKMWAAKNFQSGMQMLRQVEFSLLDMELHSQPTPDVMAVLQKVRTEVALLPSPAYSRTAHSFSHIFAGGYAAGYYSYKWAEVLSADAYASFEESVLANGANNPDTGKAYLEQILQVGASRPALASFIAFRGREPSIDALLRHSGMISSES